MLQQRELPQQRSILRALSAITAVAGQGYFALNLYRELYLLAFVELGFSLISVYVFWCCSYRNNLHKLSLAFSLSLFTFLAFCFAYEQTHVSIFIWTLVIPVIAYLLVGRRLGFGITALYFFITIVIYFHRLSGNHELFTTGPLLNVFCSTVLIWIFSHVQESSRERSEQSLYELASIDPLTGLLNRVQLEDIFYRELNRSTRYDQALSLIIFDLDHFKTVNDKHGHKAGDHALKIFSELIAGSIRRSDFAFRVGGEEFCIILAGADLHRATKIAEQLRLMLQSQTIHWSDVDIKITMSAGVAEYGQDGENLEQLYAMADKRLYHAKHNGRNRVVNRCAETAATQAADGYTMSSGGAEKL